LPQNSGCGGGPRLVIGRYVGGTAFAGVGERAVGGSASAGIGLSIPLNFFRTGSLAGTQVYGSATLTGLVSGVGAFIGSTTGVSGGISNGPVSSFVPSSNDTGSYVVQGGAAYGAGAEVQSSGPISNLAASVTAGLARGIGAYFAGGRQVNVTFATEQFGCPR